MIYTSIKETWVSYSSWKGGYELELALFSLIFIQNIKKKLQSTMQWNYGELRYHIPDY